MRVHRGSLAVEQAGETAHVVTRCQKGDPAEHVSVGDRMLPGAACSVVLLVRALAHRPRVCIGLTPVPLADPVNGVRKLSDRSDPGGHPFAERVGADSARRRFRGGHAVTLSATMAERTNRPRTGETAGGTDTPEVTGMSAKKGKARAPERGRRVAQARRRAGLTQQQLAERVGVNRVSIARIETGERVPSMSLGLRISRELGESVEGLFGGER